MEIVNLSELNPEWNWLAHRFESRSDMHWSHVSTKGIGVAGAPPKRQTWQRIAAAWSASGKLASKNSILVSHGPRMAMYGAYANRARLRSSPQLAYSFNFTHLPTGPNRAAMQKAFGLVDRFVVFSEMEKKLYAEFFQLDPARIDMLHWAVRPPALDAAVRPLVEGPYICAVGSQGRDYRVLMDAMRRIPDIRLVIVATAESVHGLSAPANVDVRIDVPIDQVHNIVMKSRFMVLPLTGSQVPCGHVTLVNAMHFGKAIAATFSEGIVDYLQSEVNGRMSEPENAQALASTIEGMFAAPEECEQMGQRGMAFAREFCVEENVVRYFERAVSQLVRA